MILTTRARSGWVLIWATKLILACFSRLKARLKWYSKRLHLGWFHNSLWYDQVVWGFWCHPTVKIWKKLLDNLFKKPRLRGHFHQETFFIALGACLLLIAKSSNQTALIASIIYSLGLLILFGISALYHRRHWEPKPRALMKHLDHSAIFILIASTATPLCLLGLSENTGRQFLLVIWVAALIGILQSIFWAKAPKYFTALFCVAMGWLTSPYLTELKELLGILKVSLIIAGGIIYSIGAIIYALKKPKLVPDIFGYHEFPPINCVAGFYISFMTWIAE